MESPPNTHLETPFTISIDQLFQGPFSLLVTLASRKEVVADTISLAPLFSQFHEYLHSTQSKTIDRGSDFVASYAHLHYLKSDALIHRHGCKLNSLNNEDSTESERTDDAKYDIQRLFSSLKAYEELQKQVFLISQMEEQALLCHARPYIEPEEITKPPIDITLSSIEELQKFFQKIISSKKNQIEHQVAQDSWSIEDAEELLFKSFELSGNSSISLASLFTQIDNRSIRPLDECIALFLAILECIKKGKLLVTEVSDKNASSTYLIEKR